MARYIVLKVDSNDIVDKLLEKFSVVSSVKVVGLFASPTKFCEGKCNSEGKSIRSRKWGTWHCPVCRLPTKARMHNPRNLLQDPNLHPRFADFFISVWEPFENDPHERYGTEAIKGFEAQVEVAKQKIIRAKRRRARNHV